MKNPGSNLIIVENDFAESNILKNYLLKRFGTLLNISTYVDEETAIKHVDKYTDIVVIDVDFEDEDDKKIIEKIKSINPNTEVVLLTSKNGVSNAIQSIQNGASNYVIKGEKSSFRIFAIIHNFIMHPVKVVVRELQVNQYLAMFLLSFLFIGVVVLVSYVFMY
jgi:DNA-binding NtrC family response regulator